MSKGAVNETSPVRDKGAVHNKSIISTIGNPNKKLVS